MAKQILTILGLAPSTAINSEGMSYNLRGMNLFIAVKQQKNTLLVSTHPELLEKIKPIIERFDVVDAEAEAAQTQTLVLYKVPGQNVTNVIQMLERLGELNPQVRLEAGPATENSICHRRRGRPSKDPQLPR